MDALERSRSLLVQLDTPELLLSKPLLLFQKPGVTLLPIDIAGSGRGESQQHRNTDEIVHGGDHSHGGMDIGSLPRNLRLDEVGQLRQGFLPAQVAHFQRNDLRHSLLHDAELSAAGNLR